jgi:hypothetical protein
VGLAKAGGKIAARTGVRPPCSQELSLEEAKRWLQSAEREHADWQSLLRDICRRDRLAALTERTAQQSKELAALKTATGTLELQHLEELIHNDSQLREAGKLVQKLEAQAK